MIFILKTRKYAVPKYAIGFVIGNNGTRIQGNDFVFSVQITQFGIFFSAGEGWKATLNSVKESR